VIAQDTRQAAVLKGAAIVVNSQASIGDVLDSMKKQKERKVYVP
jgi:hypothetical protein